MLEATWSTWLLMNSGSWRLTAISLSERILFSSRSISSSTSLVVLAGLLQVGQAAAAGLQIVCQGLADPLAARARLGGGQPGEPLLEALDLRLNLVVAGLLEEPRQGVWRVQQPQVDPQQAVEAGHLQLFQRLRRVAQPGLLQVHGDLAQFEALAAQRLEALQQIGGQASEDVPQRLLGGAGVFGPARPWPAWASTYFWNFGCAAQQAEVGDLAGQHQRQEHVGLAAEQREARRCPGRPAGSSWFRKAVFRYLAKCTGRLALA